MNQPHPSEFTIEHHSKAIMLYCPRCPNPMIIAPCVTIAALADIILTHLRAAHVVPTWRI